MKVETNITFLTTFDDELMKAFNNNTFDENVKLLGKFDDSVKEMLEQEYGGENVVVTSVFVQD
jgi:hypothetical protein